MEIEGTDLGPWPHPEHPSIYTEAHPAGVSMTKAGRIRVSRWRFGCTDCGTVGIGWASPGAARAEGKAHATSTSRCVG